MKSKVNSVLICAAGGMLIVSVINPEFPGSVFILSAVIGGIVGFFALK